MKDIFTNKEPFYLYILTQCTYCPVEYGPDELGTIDDVCKFIWSEFRKPNETDVHFNGCTFDEYEYFKEQVETLTKLFPNNRQVFFIRNNQEYKEFMGNGYFGDSVDDYDIPYDLVLYMYPIECPDMSDIFDDEEF